MLKTMKKIKKITLAAASIFSAVNFDMFTSGIPDFNFGGGGTSSLSFLLLFSVSVRKLSLYLAAYVASLNAQNDLSEFNITGSSGVLSFCIRKTNARST